MSLQGSLRGMSIYKYNKRDTANQQYNVYCCRYVIIVQIIIIMVVIMIIDTMKKSENMKKY
jgi:hypothetical protein